MRVSRISRAATEVRPGLFQREIALLRADPFQDPQMLSTAPECGLSRSELLWPETLSSGQLSGYAAGRES